MHVSCSKLGDIYHGHGSGSGQRHSKPDQRRKRESGQRRNLEPESVCRAEMANDSESEKKNGRGNRSQNNEGNVNSAMNFLPGAAVLAVSEVVLVVSAHFWRQAGNVVPPASQNFAYDRIDALAHNYN